MRSLFDSSVHCSCGRSHTSEQFSKLPLVGHQSDGDGGELELRNCPCGSTHSVPCTPEPTEPDLGRCMRLGVYRLEALS